MTDITELALIAKIKKQLENFDTVILKEAEANALVEALEKAKGMEAYWKTQCRGITDHCEELQARIAGLEYSTVTVRLPKTMYTEFDDDDYCREVAVLDRQQVIDCLTDAGIKVEVE